MKKTVEEIATLVGGRVVGDPTVVITGVASVQHAGPDDLSFIESMQQIEEALLSSAGCVLVPPAVTLEPKTIIQVERPKLVFARVVKVFHPDTRPAAGVHQTAVVSPGVEIGEDASVGPCAVIEAGVRIGSGSIVGAGVYIGRDCVIGETCILHPNVTLYPHVHLGARVVVHAGSVLGSDGFGYVNVGGVYHKFPQIGRLLIEDDVEIGSNVSIDRGTLDATIIKRGTKIDNLTQVAHNVFIGENCVLAAQVGIAGSSRIEKQTVMGGQAGIADHVTIGESAIIGGKACVPTGKRIHSGEFVWGIPARPMREVKAQYKALVQLPGLKAELQGLKERLAELEKRLGEDL